MIVKSFDINSANSIWTFLIKYPMLLDWKDFWFSVKRYFVIEFTELIKIWKKFEHWFYCLPCIVLVCGWSRWDSLLEQFWMVATTNYSERERDYRIAPITCSRLQINIENIELLQSAIVEELRLIPRLIIPQEYMPILTSYLTLSNNCRLFFPSSKDQRLLETSSNH